MNEKVRQIDCLEVTDKNLRWIRTEALFRKWSLLKRNRLRTKYYDVQYIGTSLARLLYTAYGIMAGSVAVLEYSCILPGSYVHVV